ncbi:MAG: 3-deoxy-manno-octulosonate cytidylyltransferase [Prevotella sp.]|nr:3-deoxy-manno-octulosonate cytidylyltransferase [Prevotella sp.]
MKFIGIIPARYASSRFPGKPLAVLGGKTVIQRVVEQVSSVLSDVYVATDDERIQQVVASFGGKSIMTRQDHKSGTDRICEALDIILKIEKQERGDKDATVSSKLDESDVIINIQGDEPFVQRSQIETVMRCFEDKNTHIATLGKRFETMEEVLNPNSPKIVLDNQGYAMYFSRSVIPFVRGKKEAEWIENYPFLKHIGLYAYRTSVLREITRLPQSSLELVESLEQLRWLQNGYRIRVGKTDVETVGIDTPEDLERAERFLYRTNM